MRILKSIVNIVLIFIIFIVLVCGLSLFLFCAIKIASKCTREEERRNAYVNTWNDIKK